MFRGEFYMTLSKKKLHFIISSLFILTIFLSSCSSTGFLMAKPEVLKYGQLFPVKDETEQIDIYSALLPTKEYIEIAQITCKDTEDDWNLKQILIKAREIGADGIIILGTAGNAG